MKRMKLETCIAQLRGLRDKLHHSVDGSVIHELDEILVELSSIVESKGSWITLNPKTVTRALWVLGHLAEIVGNLLNLAHHDE